MTQGVDSVTNEEINSAERAAEEIIEGAYAEARAEVCPQGEDCAVHFRVDEEFFDEDSKYARLITYSGDYAVITDDSQALSSPVVAVKAMIGLPITRDDVPNRWETLIYHVGDGVVGDLVGMTLEERRDALRYVAGHDEWEFLKGFHGVTLEALWAGMIDVSKPYEGK